MSRVAFHARARSVAIASLVAIILAGCGGSAVSGRDGTASTETKAGAAVDGHVITVPLLGEIG